MMPSRTLRGAVTAVKNCVPASSAAPPLSDGEESNLRYLRIQAEADALHIQGLSRPTVSRRLKQSQPPTDTGTLGGSDRPRCSVSSEHRSSPSYSFGGAGAAARARRAPPDFLPSGGGLDASDRAEHIAALHDIVRRGHAGWDVHVPATPVPPPGFLSSSKAAPQ